MEPKHKESEGQQYDDDRNLYEWIVYEYQRASYQGSRHRPVDSDGSM